MAHFFSFKIHFINLINILLLMLQHLHLNSIFRLFLTYILFHH